MAWITNEVTWWFQIAICVVCLLTGYLLNNWGKLFICCPVLAWCQHLPKSLCQFLCCIASWICVLFHPYLNHKSEKVYSTEYTLRNTRISTQSHTATHSHILNLLRRFLFLKFAFFFFLNKAVMQTPSARALEHDVWHANLTESISGAANLEASRLSF